METLFAKELIAILGPSGVIFIAGIYFLNKKIKKNCDKIEEQKKEDAKHLAILNKHDTSIQLLQKDMGYLKENSDSMDKKLDRLLEK